MEIAFDRHVTPLDATTPTGRSPPGERAAETVKRSSRWADQQHTCCGRYQRLPHGPALNAFAHVTPSLRAVAGIVFLPRSSCMRYEM